MLYKAILSNFFFNCSFFLGQRQSNTISDSLRLVSLVNKESLLLIIEIEASLALHSLLRCFHQGLHAEEKPLLPTALQRLGQIS